MATLKQVGRKSIYLIQPQFPPSYWGQEHFLKMTPYGAVYPPLGLITLSALTQPGEPYYEVIRNWIANGAQLKLDTPRVSKIDIQPRNPIAQHIGEKQQFRVLATYADGKVKDVTRESFVEAGNTPPERL